MRIPSEEAFAALEMGVTATEQDVLAAHYATNYHSEHAAFIVLKALRNNFTIEDVLKADVDALDSTNATKAYKAVKKLLLMADPSLSDSKMESFFWSLPPDYRNEDRIYLMSAFLSYGESFSSLLVSFRNANNSNVPEYVPVTWFKKFFDGEESLRDEGIVLQADVSMVLFGYWDIDSVVDFLVRNVDLKEVTKLRAAGIEDAEEIADITELLPAEWLDEFFG